MVEPPKLLDILAVAECLKNTTRYCYTSHGCHESVAAHSWRAALMAFFLRNEFPEADMDKERTPIVGCVSFLYKHNHLPAAVTLFLTIFLWYIKIAPQTL